MSEKLDLVEFRRGLHRRPELSGKELQTARTIEQALNRFGPTGLITGLGGHGVAGIFDTGRPGPTVMLRADLDALPIAEENEFAYKSETPGSAHACGHDGHMSILVGVAERLQEILPDLNGRVILLFQPAEEIAQGAKAVIEDEKFKRIDPDYVFGLHNLPGFPEGSVIIRNGEFASASQGLITRFKGKTSHAGEPQYGKSPVLAMTSAIHALMLIPAMYTPLERSALVTIIHARLGEKAFGTSPGYAEVMATFRSHRNQEMQIMEKKAEELVKGIAGTYGLEHSTEWVEVFPAICNDPESVLIVEQAAKELDMVILRPEHPFSWTEDFSYYLRHHNGAFFGLGSGKDHPQLHNPNYDFPDSIIPHGIEVYVNIVKSILGFRLK
jgi:amidohydrolase